MQDRETPKKRVQTRWDQPVLTNIGFTSLDPPSPARITDVDGLTKCQRLVSDICDASHEIEEGEVDCDLMQQSLVDLNWILVAMKNRMVELEAEIGMAGELQHLRRGSSLYAEFFTQLNDPLDFTLPWPPTSPEIVSRYNALLKQAAKEVAVSVQMTEHRLRPYLEKKQRSAELSSSSPLSIEPPATLGTSRLDELLQSSLSDATQVHHWESELAAVSDDIRRLPLPVYMPSYPEPYKDSTLPNLPSPNIPPKVAALIRAHQWVPATETFVRALNHTLTRKPQGDK